MLTRLTNNRLAPAQSTTLTRMASPSPLASSPTQPNTSSSLGPNQRNPPETQIPYSTSHTLITLVMLPFSPTPEPTIEPLLNHHPMLSRSKHHISKPKIPTDGTTRYPLPKALIVATTDSQITSEPTCFTTASKNPKWRQAMNLEFDALIKK